MPFFLINLEVRYCGAESCSGTFYPGMLELLRRRALYCVCGLSKRSGGR